MSKSITTKEMKKNNAQKIIEKYFPHTPTMEDCAEIFAYGLYKLKLEPLFNELDELYPNVKYHFINILKKT